MTNYSQNSHDARRDSDADTQQSNVDTPDGAMSEPRGGGQDIDSELPIAQVLPWGDGDSDTQDELMDDGPDAAMLDPTMELSATTDRVTDLAAWEGFTGGDANRPPETRFSFTPDAHQQRLLPSHRGDADNADSDDAGVSDDVGENDAHTDQPPLAEADADQARANQANAHGAADERPEHGQSMAGSGVIGNLIGYVVASESAKSPNFLVHHFRILADMPSPRPGTMVAVQADIENGHAVYTLARVANVWEVNPHEDAFSSNLRDVLPIRTDYAREGNSTVIYRVAEIEPLEEAEVRKDGTIADIHDVQTLARAGAPVYFASEDLVIGALGTDPDPDDGMFMGHVRGDPSIPIILRRSAIQRHVLIVGGIGTGKSYTRGVLGEELHCLGVPQVNLDVNGEMIEAAREIGGKNLKPGEGFTLPLSAFTAEDVINAVPSLNGNMVDLVRHAHEELLKEARRTGQHFLIDKLIKKIAEVGPALEMKPVTVKPATSRTESLRRIRYLGEPYDWKSVLIPGAFINIDCRGLLVSDLRIIAAAVARDIQRLADAKEIPFVVLSIDEFHLIAPAHEETVALQVLREIARVGRHLRIGLILTTQSPQDVDRSILKRLLTRFLHAIEPDQLEALRGVLSDASEDLVKQLPKMPQGVCILTGAYETVKHATVIEVRKRVTTHGGATPNVWADFEARGWSKKLSLATLKEQSAKRAQDAHSPEENGGNG